MFPDFHCIQYLLNQELPSDFLIPAMQLSLFPSISIILLLNSSILFLKLNTSNSERIPSEYAFSASQDARSSDRELPD